MALTQRMRALLLFAATIGVVGCSREERDVLRAFPAPRLMSQTSGNPSVWKLQVAEPTRLQLRLRAQSAGGVAFRVVQGTLDWAPAAGGLSGSLRLRADADLQHEASAQLDRAWPLSDPASPIEAHFRVLESDALTHALDLENPERQTANVGLRGELEARGIRSELQVFLRVEVAASRSQAAAERDPRLVTARCEKTTVLQPLRYGLDLRESRKAGRTAAAAEVGCQLTFVAHRLSSNASLAQKDSPK